MAENEKNVRAEETQEPQANQDEQNVTEIETEKSSLDADLKDVENMSDQQRGKKEIEGQITKNLKDLGDRLENYKKVLFLRMLKARGEDVEIPEGQGDISIDEKYAEEFATYSKEPISTEDLMAPDSPYTIAKNQLIGTLRNRENKLNEMIGKSGEIGRVQELLNQTNSKLDSLNKERNNPETTPERKEELDGLIKRLETVKEGIEGKDISNSRGESHKFGLLDKAQKAARQHMTIKREALKALGQQVAPYAKDGASFVYDDKDITDSIGKYDAERDRLENIVKNIPTQEAPENEEKTEPTEPEEKTEQTEAKEINEGNGQQAPQQGGKVGNAAGNQKAATAAGQPVQGAASSLNSTLQEIANGKIPSGSLHVALGVNSLSSLDYKGSWQVLRLFSSMGESTCLDMLNDPQSRQIVMKAFEEVGSFHPFRGAGYFSTRMKLLNLRGPLMEQALKNMGINLTDSKKLVEEFNKIPEFVELGKENVKNDPNLTPEQKKEALKMYDDYQKSYTNIKLFDKATTRIKTPRTLLAEIKNKISYKFSKKENLQQLAAAENEKFNKEENVYETSKNEQEVPVQEAPVVEEKKQPVNDFQARNAGLVNKADQAVISEETREAKKQEQLAKETQNKNEINQKGEDENTPTVPGE